MPEILTKHPQVVKKVLKSEGIECGKGNEQKILKNCPKEGFCELKGGELCVYGLDKMDEVTQFSKKDICFKDDGKATTYSYSLLGSLAASFFAGVLLAFLFIKIRSRR